MNIDFVTWVSFTGILVYCVHFVWSREKLNKEYFLCLKDFYIEDQSCHVNVSEIQKVLMKSVEYSRPDYALYQRRGERHDDQ